MAAISEMHAFRPIRALMNGLLVTILGFIITSLPGIAIALSIGFDLGPQGMDQEEISRTIRASIDAFYSGNVLLQIAATLVVALLVFWRARVCARGTGGHAVSTGLLVTVVPVIADIVSSAMMVGGVPGLLLPAAYIAAGYLGGTSVRSAGTTES